MALIPKTTNSVQSPYDTEATIEVKYAVIDRFKSYDKVTRYASFDLDIYTRICTKDDRRTKSVTPIESVHHEISGDDFDAYLSVSAVTADDNQYKQAYLWLLNACVKQVETEVNDLDEEGNITGTHTEYSSELVYKDWQSDE